MNNLILIQVGRTVWETEDRLDSLAGSPLCDEDSEITRKMAEESLLNNVTSIYASSNPAESEVATLIAGSSDIAIYDCEELSEIDYGLWQGLKIEEVKRRQPRLHKQWLESPSGVRPPGGETLLEAQERVWEAVYTILRKTKDKSPALVMRPVVMGLLQCKFRDISLDDIWEHVKNEPELNRIEVNISGKEMILVETDENG